MSIQSEIDRISNNVNNAIQAVEAKGVSVPEGSNSDNLPELINEIFVGYEDAVRYSAQSLSDEQKLQARENIGAVSETELSNEVTSQLTTAKESGEFDGRDGLNGTNGQDGYTPVKGVDYYTPEEKAEWEEFIASELAKRGQLKPEFAQTIEECTDTSKLYVLPDGFIYAYMYTEKPAYTNVLSTAVDSDGTPYNGGLGYKTDTSISATNVEQTYTGRCCTGYIPVEPNDVIRIKNTGKADNGGFHLLCGTNFAPAIAGYYGYYEDTNRGYNTNPDENGVITITIPAGVYYYRYSAGTIDNTSIFTLNEEITDEGIKEYAWTNTGHAFVPADYEERIVGLEADVAKHEAEIASLKEDIENGTLNIQGEIPEVIIPSKLYGVVGHEFVLYYYNILRCMIPEDFIVTTVFSDSSDGILSLYPQFDRMLKFTPTADHIGTHNITIKVIDRRTWETVATKESSIIIVADTARTNKKVLFIGDSLTQASTYIAEIERMTDNGISSIGTVHSRISFNGGVAETEHEGRSGWASYDYMKNSTRNNFTNPFYNPDVEYSLTLDKKYNLPEFELTIDDSGDLSVLKHHFDLAYYVANAGVGVPDAVFINLGTNGGNGYALPYVYIAFDAMIDRIRAYSSTIPIFLHLFPPEPSRGNGMRNKNGVRNVRRDYDAPTGYYDCIKTLIERYENNPNVILVPTYLMLDTIYDFKFETVPVSARNDIEVTIGQSDGHPAVPGYLHMADSYYNVLQYTWGS